MSETELSEIERRLGLRLPDSYRSSALAYPFSAGSFADECMLPNSPDVVIDLNESAGPIPGITEPFFVGSDGGEELYFVDVSTPESPVFVYDLERARHRILVGSWNEYLEHIRATHVDITADETETEQRKRQRRWWQLWK